MISGPDKADAIIDFRSFATLVRGPSDTGKSYIRDCLWYLLGGDKVPKALPQAVGYGQMVLTVVSDGQSFEIVRGLEGGEAHIRQVFVDASGFARNEPIDEDLNDFLVRLSGAQGKELLRSKSKKGAVTSGDFRHWFLLSQPHMISEEVTSGVGVNATQRTAAFHLFLTGSDDSAIQVAKTNAERERISGQITGAELSLARINAEIPSELERDDVAQSLERVDAALGAMSRQYEARAAALKELRASILPTAAALQSATTSLEHSRSMVERFELLDKKYRSDIERLGATWEGVSMFQALEEVDCPLCGTPASEQLDPQHLKQGAQDNYRRALKAEATKIQSLRAGLSGALVRERERVAQLDVQVAGLKRRLSHLEGLETAKLNETKVEFTAEPKTLALRRSELSEILSKMDEMTRLRAEIDRLTKSKRRSKVELSRNVGDEGKVVAEYAKDLLHAWGFTSIETVALDVGECDLVIDGRARLSFGAGKRAIFLTAMTVALMQHAMTEGYPHIGFVVIDSPLKSYADPKSAEVREVPVRTVTDNFYDWLATWKGKGQIVILENQDISASTASTLRPIEFSGVDGQGRYGFYPLRE
ncbi:hypothetical protein ISN73_20935 [Dyella acidisoli]